MSGQVEPRSIPAIDYVDDEDDAVRAALARFARGAGRVDVILTAGGRSTDPSDPFFTAVDALGGRVVRRGVPAHPGSMLWLARIGRTAVLGLPTCGAYSKATAADLLLPRLLTGEPPTRRTVSALGHGGVLTREMRFRFPAYARDSRRWTADRRGPAPDGVAEPRRGRILTFHVSPCCRCPPVTSSSPGGPDALPPAVDTAGSGRKTSSAAWRTGRRGGAASSP